MEQNLAFGTKSKNSQKPVQKTSCKIMLVTQPVQSPDDVSTMATMPLPLPLPLMRCGGVCLIPETASKVQEHHHQEAPKKTVVRVTRFGVGQWRCLKSMLVAGLSQRVCIILLLAWRVV